MTSAGSRSACATAPAAGRSTVTAGPQPASNTEPGWRASSPATAGLKCPGAIEHAAETCATGHATAIAGTPAGADGTSRLDHKLAAPMPVHALARCSSTLPAQRSDAVVTG